MRKFWTKFNSKNYSIQKIIQFKKIHFKKLFNLKKIKEYSIQNLIQNVEIGRIQFNNIFIQ